MCIDLHVSSGMKRAFMDNMLVLLLRGTPVSRFFFFQGTTGRVTFYTFHSSVTQHARKKAVMIIPSKKGHGFDLGCSMFLFFY